MSIQTPTTLNIGSMRNRIRIQQDMALQSASGATVPQWEDFAEVWAAIEPAGGMEVFQAQQIYPESPINITIRYLQGITEAMRVLWHDPRTQKDFQYDIKSVTDVDNRHHFMTLAAIQRPIERNA